MCCPREANVILITGAGTRAFAHRTANFGRDNDFVASQLDFFSAMPGAFLTGHDVRT